MNRKQRRETSKRLGILQFQQKLSISKKFELMRLNIIAGKQREAEVKEEVRQEINVQLEKKESDVIYSIAEFIAKQKNIPIIDAMDEAQRMHDKK